MEADARDNDTRSAQAKVLLDAILGGLATAASEEGADETDEAGENAPERILEAHTDPELLERPVTG